MLQMHIHASADIRAFHIDGIVGIRGLDRMSQQEAIIYPSDEAARQIVAILTEYLDAQEEPRVEGTLSI